MKKITYLVTLLLTLVLSLNAQAFVVRKIEFQGLQRVSPSTVASYLPIKQGQSLELSKTASVLSALYKTGFFERISLSQNGDTLIVHVIERPTIGELKISGNSIVPTDKLTSVMKTLDIAEGRVYNAAILEKIKQSLLNQYYQLGRYNARVDVKVLPMSRNRVQVKIEISEGLVAKVRRIVILGNHVFSDNTLIKQMDLTIKGWYTFITQTDRYSEEKLESSLEKIRNYYLDRGYLHFTVKSYQAQVTPDRKSVFITIVVDEGQPYTLKNFELKGELIVFSHDEYLNKVALKPGDVFSRQKIIDAEKNITKSLGDKGYLFATVNLVPHVDETRHEVTVTFEVKPGKRAYVRQIIFSENSRTNDEVLRRESQQFEAAPVSTSKLDQTKQRLSLLPYIRDVDMSINPVPGIDDQVDVNYKVKEDSPAQASFRVGYSRLDGALIGAGLNHKNFFGTGEDVGLNLQYSKVQQSLGLDFTDPYYTDDGISRSFNFAVTRTDPGKIKNFNNGYISNEYDAGILFGIPVGQEENVFNRIQAGLTYENILIIPSGGLSNQVSTFLNDHGRHYQEADFKLGYSRDSRDKAIFPTSGSLQTLFLDAYAPLDKKSVSFYTLTYGGKWYMPINDQFIFLSRADLGYGNGFHGINDFPFFKNFYAGGIDSVRGYEPYTLGPRDSNYGSQNRAIGANMLVDGSIGMIFPNFISDNLRTSIFLDGGNVYSSADNRRFGGASTNSGPLRYSLGIEGDILSPFGPVKLSLAKALNARKGDDTQVFDFALGANF